VSGDAQAQVAGAADQARGGGEDPQSPGFPAADRASKASICIQASSSQARAMVSHQIWFWA
jgi:hypothetical protein